MSSLLFLLPLLSGALFLTITIAGLYRIGRTQFIASVVTVVVIAVLTSIALSLLSQTLLVSLYSYAPSLMTSTPFGSADSSSSTSSMTFSALVVFVLRSLLVGLTQPTVTSIALCGVLFLVCYTVAKGVDLLEQIEILLESHKSFAEKDGPLVGGGGSGEEENKKK